jgi:glc operon protein GlcG
VARDVPSSLSWTESASIDGHGAVSRLSSNSHQDFSIVRLRSIAFLAGLLVAFATPLRAQVIRTSMLSMEGAKNIMAAAEAEAAKNSWRVSIAIVDASGGLVLFHKGDGTKPSNVEFSIAKARTAARFQSDSKRLDSAVTAGRIQYLAADAFPMEGGVPIRVDGIVIGAVGVSGATSAQDAEVARIGIAALRTAP